MGDFIELETGSFWDEKRFRCMVARKYVVSLSPSEEPHEGFPDLVAFIDIDASGREKGGSGVGLLYVSKPSYQELKRWLLNV